MDLYDPENPSINYSYNFFQLSNNVLYELNRHLHYGDLLLSVDSYYIGLISCVCEKIFCQSKFRNGIIKIQTSCNKSIGHLVIVRNIAHHFIPIADNGFVIDNQILYKREPQYNCRRVSRHG